MRHHGIDKLLKPHQKPNFDKRIAEAYSEEELASLFNAATSRERPLFQSFAFSSCREAEVAHAEWQDIKFPNSTMMVRSMRKKGFGPQDTEERLIALPDSLMASLKAHRKANPTTRYLFPNKEGKPDGHQLRTLKKLALRGGLNCGEGNFQPVAPVWRHKAADCTAQVSSAKIVQPFAASAKPSGFGDGVSLTAPPLAPPMPPDGSAVALRFS